MNESDLIKRFREIINLIPDKESRVKYASEPSVLLNEIEQLKKEKDIISEQLRTCNDKKTSSNKLESVKTMLQRLYDRFSKNYPHNFSRDQGMIVHGFILLKICEDISYALDHQVTFLSEYYFEIGGDFDNTEIVRILKETVDYLNTNKIDNYPDLFNYSFNSETNCENR